MGNLDDRLAALRARMVELEVDTFFLMSPENRRYITGFTGSNGFVIVTADDALLITDSRYVEQAENQAPLFRVIRYDLSPYATLEQEFMAVGAKRVGYESNKLDDSTITKMRNQNSGIEFVPTIDILLEMRRIKDDSEIENLVRAIQIADEALEKLMPILKIGMTERDIAIELDYLMRKSGSSGESFATIAVSGVRTSLPHGQPTDKAIESGDFLTLDFGAIYQGYHSDITRTIRFGEPDKKLSDVFDIVAKAQEAAFEAIKPGMKCKDIDAAHRAVFTEHGVEQYSLRGLGHGIGLEIHELPRVVMNNEAVLENNMIFTVEPGIYIPGLGGVRTEDVVLLRDGKAEILTRSERKLIVG